MKIAFCSSEVFPFAKTGGLGDVSAALPDSLAKAGVEVKVFMPLLKGIKPQEMHGDFGVTKQGSVEVFFIKNDDYFLRDSIYVGEDGRDYPDSLERFSFYSKGVLKALKKINFCPDIIHSNDWQTSLVNVYLKTLYKEDVFFKNTKCILTIHNLAYQGLSDGEKFSLLGIPDKFFDKEYFEFYGKVNLLKGGIVFSDVVTTVSPTYAKQIQFSEFGCGLEGILRKKGKDLIGILNAIDYDIWDPAKDNFIYKKYSPNNLGDKTINRINLQKELGLAEDEDALFMGMVSRLAEQKGIDILSKAIDEIASNCQLVILGVGEPRYHEILREKADKFKDSFSLVLDFDEALAHKIYAGIDVFLLPSRFEPCGLSQMISYKYATLPLVNHTGGLVDTVKDVSDGGGGFIFNNYDSLNLLTAIDEAKEAFKDKGKWQTILEKVTKFNFSWEVAANEYIETYKRLIN
ncbi:MAG: glycogen synthase [Candidatus Omnitrophica bacterium]|nr:glycogen synthase [Candidatus Omnitrophota bacterium]